MYQVHGSALMLLNILVFFLSMFGKSRYRGHNISVCGRTCLFLCACKRVFSSCLFYIYIYIFMPSGPLNANRSATIRIYVFEKIDYLESMALLMLS